MNFSILFIIGLFYLFSGSQNAYRDDAVLTWRPILQRSDLFF